MLSEWVSELFWWPLMCFSQAMAAELNNRTKLNTMARKGA